MGLLNWRFGEHEEMKRIDDLLDWEEENDKLLPPGWTAEQIAEVEAQGKIVNLETGEIEEAAVLL
jgi:hypothetical protein